jgi:hypothetical protein
MPKIIYRPEPTPPPFVPPTPSYDTVINAVSQYQYYDENQLLDLKFAAAQVPVFNRVEIFQNNVAIGQAMTESLPTNDFLQFETTGSGSAPFSGEIKFYKSSEGEDEILVWTAVLEVSWP